MTSTIEDNEPLILLCRMLQRAVGNGRQEFGSFFLSRLLGFGVSYEGEQCVVAFDAVAPLLNPQGTLHGGILATALDVSRGIFCITSPARERRSR